MGLADGEAEGWAVGIVLSDGIWEREGELDAVTVGLVEAVTVGIWDGLGEGS